MNSSDLCSDVMLEILSRVSLPTLGRCRLLSSEYNKLTYKSSFMRLHCQRTNTIAGFFIQSLYHNRHHSTFLSELDNNLSLDFLPNRLVKILASAQGLIYCVGQFSEDCYICKPSTRQWESIPNPNLRYFTAKTGMIVLGSNPVRFKIVRLSYPDPEDYPEDYDPEFNFYDYKRLHCEVFDSKIWGWEQCDDLIIPFHEYFSHNHAVSACGELHWLTSNGNKQNILSFHEDKENWELVSLPGSLRHKDDWDSVNLAEYEGKLSLICVKPDTDFVEVWVVKDYYKERVWRREDSLNFKKFNKEFGHCWAASFYNADTLLMIGLYTAIFYNFKTGQFDRLDLPLKHKYIESTFFVYTDYEPLNFRQPRRISPSSMLTTSLFLILVFLFLIILS